MPAVARSPLHGPRRGPSFGGATETPHFGNHNVGPNHLDYLSGWFVLPSLRPDLLPLFEFLFQSRSADPKIGPMQIQGSLS